MTRYFVGGFLFAVLLGYLILERRSHTEPTPPPDGTKQRYHSNIVKLETDEFEATG